MTGIKPEGERLQKLLARLGLGSRREIERWIAAGRITVNGKTAGLGDRVLPSDKIVVDGKPVRPVATEGAACQVLLYHKPIGQVCSRSDPEGRESIFDALPAPKQGRWVSIGRLDLNTSGLLLLTNDGELAHRLMHPSREIEREYAVRVLGRVAPETLARLCAGVALDDGPAAFSEIRDGGGQGANHWYHVVLREGRNREVRRLWESQGLQVSRLIRVRFGPIRLPKRLPAGGWRPLDTAEVADLRRQVGLA